MPDHDQRHGVRHARRKNQMSFGRRTSGAVRSDAALAETALARRDQVVPDAFRPLSFIAADGSSQDLTGDPSANAALPSSPYVASITAAIEAQLEEARRASGVLPVGERAARDSAGGPDAGIAPDFDDGGAEGEAQARSFVRSFRLSGLHREASRAGRAVGDAARGAGRAAGRAAVEAKRDAERGIGHMHHRIHNWIQRARGVEEIDPLGAGEAQEPPFSPLEQGPGWRVRNDQEMLHHRTQLGGEKSNLNRVDRVWYGDPGADPATSRDVGFFKPEPVPGTEAPAQAASLFRRTGNDRYRLAARAVMTSALDKALGTDVIADEAFAEHLNWRTGKMEMGNVSSAVEGKPLKGGAPDPVQSELRGVPTLTEPFATDVPLRSAAAQRGFSDLQVIDWITGQVDRHGGNIFVTDAGAVKGIDNDLAFGPEVDLTGVDKNVGLPPVVHDRTARAIEAMSEEDLERLLDDAVPPSERLTKDADLPAGRSISEMGAAKERLRRLKDHLKKDGVVVSSFNDDTFDEMRATGESPAVSYLDQHAMLVDAIGRAESGEMVAKDYPLQDPNDLDSVREVHHRMVLDDPNADLSSWARGARTGAVAGDTPRDEAPARGAPGGRGRSRSQGEQPVSASPQRDRALSSPDLSASSGAPARGGDGSGEGAVEGARGSNRSGKAETRGDEERLGRRGEAGRGEKSAYGRFVRAFGRDQQGSRAAFQQFWDRVAQEREATRIAQEAARGPSVLDSVGATIAAELSRSYEDLPPLGDPGSQAAPEGAPDRAGADAADEGAGLPAVSAGAPTESRDAAPTGSPPADASLATVDAQPRAASRRRRFVRVAARNWSQARQLAGWLGAGFLALLQKLRSPRDEGETETDDASNGDSGPFRRDDLSKGDGWVVLDAGSVKTHTPPGDEARTNVNRVDKVIFTRPIPGSDATLGFFKPEASNPDSHHLKTYDRTSGAPARLAARAVLSSALDQALGTKVLAIEVFGRFKNPQTGNWETGNVSAAVPGRALQGNVHADPSKPIAPDGVHAGNLVKELNNAVDLRSPEVQRGMTDLQTMDWLSAQTDRHGGNIFVTEDGRVHGIDNDFSFGGGVFAFPGPDAPVKKTIDNQNVGMPAVLSQQTADAVRAMTPERLQQVLDGAVPESERLGTNEMDAAKSRLAQLQQAIHDKSVEVVSSFDGATYDKLRQEGKTGWGKPQSTSYLNGHATLVEAAASGALDGGEMLEKDDGTYVKVFTVNEDPNVNVGALAPTRAASEVLELPTSPYDAALDREPAGDATFNQPASGALSSALASGAQGGRDGAAGDAAAMSWVDGSAPSNEGSASGPSDSTSVAAGRPTTGVDDNVRHGRAASESQASGSADSASRSFYALKRRSHAGSAPRAEGSKTPAGGKKNRNTTSMAKHRKKKG